MYHAANHKIATLALTALLTLPTLAVVSRPASGEPLKATLGREFYRYDFSKTVKPWMGGASYSPNVDGPLRPESNDVLSLGSNKKESYAALTNGGADLLWMYTTFKANASLLHVRFDVANVEGAERLTPIVYVGKEAPTSVIGFQKIGDPLERGPQTLHLLVDLGEAGLNNGEFVLAIGYMNLDNVQAKQVASIDNVVVVIDDGE